MPSIKVIFCYCCHWAFGYVLCTHLCMILQSRSLSLSSGFLLSELDLLHLTFSFMSPLNQSTGYAILFSFVFSCLPYCFLNFFSTADIRCSFTVTPDWWLARNLGHSQESASRLNASNSSTQVSRPIQTKVPLYEN